MVLNLEYITLATPKCSIENIAQGGGGGVALSLISLPIERAHSLRNSLHEIYLDLLVYEYCIDFLYLCINFL